MSLSELQYVLDALKFKLWQHIEERASYATNQGYVRYLENSIEEVQQRIAKAKQVAA